MEHETNLRALRHRHGVCLTELADACGTAQPLERELKPLRGHLLEKVVEQRE